MTKARKRRMEECSPLLNRSKVRLILETFLPRDKAREIIQLFNTFRRDKTSLAFEDLFWYFVWEPNGMDPTLGPPMKFVEIVPDTHLRFVKTPTHSRREYDDADEPRRVFGNAGKVNDIDNISTAATDGFTLWINRTKIMNREFDKKNTHFGSLPRTVSHFSAVMLHEFGHVLRQRAGRTTVETMFRQSPELRKCYNEFQHKISKAREYRSEEEVNEMSDEMEEWFADIFAKSFIIYAYGERK